MEGRRTMRIISQNKSIDVNYDNVYVMVSKGDENYTLACGFACEPQSMVLGVFKDEDTAMEVMINIQGAKSNRFFVPEDK